MICPVCKRDLAPTLSICLTCGTMMNDTVREELQTKVAPSSDSGRLAARPNTELPPVPARVSAPAPIPRPIATPKPAMPASARVAVPVSSSTARAALPATTATPSDVGRQDTSGLHSKKTSPTLVEFQSKNAMIPDWRLQLQNTVRQRSTSASTPATAAEPAAAAPAQLVSSGARALKSQPATASVAVEHTNPRVAKALQRIEQSRQAFLESPKPQASAATARPTAGRNYPFNVIERSSNPAAAQRTAEPAVANAKPRLVSSLRIEKKGLDTNKLPPLEQPIPFADDIASDKNADKIRNGVISSPDRIQIRHEAAEVEMYAETQEVESDEIDDLAPFSMRFGAGVFDAIIGLFATAILLSPLVLSAGEWMSFSGMLAFVAGFAIVMFVYLTATIGLVGRTVGMRLFSLEMIDAEENAYPTLHQAAVSSSVYLLSIAVGGLGFLPMLFNEEKRAVHDLLSGTILIREI